MEEGIRIVSAEEGACGNMQKHDIVGGTKLWVWGAG